jgi:asparagine synthase (glutamine-hydrolysing)
MCGIAGQYCMQGGEPDKRLLAEMSRRLAHRGPDGEGTYFSGNVGLAHRRLAIIDLSDDGLQPMCNDDRSICLVFNGEIYNYIELREELREKGHRFASQSDTEVIIHAYEEWGRDCLARFNGMWAFALYDGRKQEIFCSRDRFGIKPFYYTRVNGSFLFASEIKALLSHHGAGKRPDDAMLGTYLAWGVLDHTGRTMFDGIFQLPPAHAMVVNRDGLQPAFRYWDVRVNPARSSDTPEDEHAAKLLSALRNATSIHLRSDVPVGTCLSGGIDSSTLVALINELIRTEAPSGVGSRQKTFSVYFDDPRFDERRYIDEVVAATGVDATRVRPEAGEAWTELQQLLYQQDEPFGSLSVYAQYRVMRLAREKVKVVLDGQGADELLAGYLAYEGSYIGGLLRSLHWLTAIRELAGAIRHHRGFFSDAVRQIFVRSRRRDLLRGDIPAVHRYSGSLDQVLQRELMATNLPALLHYEDRNSMAFSIEARVPFLDVRLVEYIASLPLDRKVRHGVTKHVLRRVIKGVIPESVRCRMDKMGFVTPEEVWMKGELRPHVLALFSSDSFRSRPYWDAKAVSDNYSAFLSGSSEYSPELFRIACAELWLRRFFDARASDGLSVIPASA